MDRVVVGSDVRRAGDDEIGPAVGLRRREKVLRPDADSRAGSREAVAPVRASHQGELVLESLHHPARCLVRIELRLDRPGKPPGRRLEDVRERAGEELPMRTVRGSPLPNRAVEADQVVDVPLVEPVSDAVGDACVIFRCGFSVVELVPDRVEVPLQNGVLVMASLDAGDQRGDGVDVAAPEVLAVPLRLHGRRAAPAEDVRDHPDLHTLPVGVAQGLRGDEGGESRGIGVDPMDRVLPSVAEIPTWNRVVVFGHPLRGGLKRTERLFMTRDGRFRIRNGAVSVTHRSVRW